MQDYKKDAYREAYLQCSNAIQNMEKELRAACNASDAKVDNVIKVVIIYRYTLGFHLILIFVTLLTKTVISS